MTARLLRVKIGPPTIEVGSALLCKHRLSAEGCAQKSRKNVYEQEGQALCLCIYGLNYLTGPYCVTAALRL